MSYSQRIRASFTRETYDQIEQYSNREAGTNLGTMVRILVDEALEARATNILDADAKMYLYISEGKKKQEKERILHTGYIQWQQDGAIDKEQEKTMIDYAARHDLQYPPLNIDPVSIDPNLRRIMRLVTEHERIRLREICNGTHMLKSDVIFYLEKLEKMGRITTHDGKGNTVWVELIKAEIEPLTVAGANLTVESDAKS